MNQYEKNKKIEQLVMSKDLFTQEELNFIAQYTGMGGLESQGATEEGLLYEYYTPHDLIKKMWALALKFGYNGGKILEPSVGIGRTVLYTTNQEVLAYEVSPISAKICRLLNPNATVIEKSFSYHFVKNGKNLTDYQKDFELVIGNPPYGEFKDENTKNEISHLKLKGMRYDHYFIARSLDVLKPGGLLVFVVTDSLFFGKHPQIEAYIEEKAELLDAYLLPDKTFPTTKQPTSLIVLRKK
jgi:type I restriction-modification system DNA methylase subunit